MPEKIDIEQTRRRQILDAAEKVFVARGIDKARMDDIVEESGLSKGALYWYFKSKDAIIRAVVDRVFISELREIEALVLAEGSASGRLVQFVEFAVREYKRFEKMLPLAYEFVALAARNKTVRKTVILYFDRYKTIIADIIQQGVDRGEFKPCDADIVALSIISMYEGMAMLWFIEPSLVDWDVMGLEPIKTILTGLIMENT
jgi:AcrR family transcriptional regulator